MDAWDPGARAPAEAAAAAAHLVRYLDRADSIEVVRNVFQNFIKGFGFTSVTCLMLPRDGRMDAESILMSTRPPLFIETYLARGHFRFDPVIKEIARRREAFVWSEIKPKGRRLTRAERKVLRLRATFGLEGGFTVPVRESGGNLGSVNIAGSTAELDDGQRAALILASVYVYGPDCARDRSHDVDCAGQVRLASRPDSRNLREDRELPYREREAEIRGGDPCSGRRRRHRSSKLPH